MVKLISLIININNTREICQYRNEYISPNEIVFVEIWGGTSSSSTQITLGSAQGTLWGAGIELGLSTYKASTLSAVLSPVPQLH